MVKAEDLVGKSYGEANALTGLEFNLRDHNTDHHLIQDLAQAETYLGIAEALQPENNSPTLTQKFSRLRNLSDYVSSRFNNFKHTKTAAALTAAGMISAATFGALTKDLGVELPDIVMENAEAQYDEAEFVTYRITSDAQKQCLPTISGDHLAWASEDGSITVLNIYTGNKQTIPANIELNDGDFDLSEKYLVYSNWNETIDRSLIIYYNLTKTPWEKNTIEVGGLVREIAINEENLAINSYTGDNNFYIINLKTEDERDIADPYPYDNYRYMPDIWSDKVVYEIEGYFAPTNSIYYYDLDTNEEIVVFSESQHSAYEPAIWQNKIVYYLDIADHESEEGIYVYDTTYERTTQIIGDTASISAFPKIHDYNVVYSIQEKVSFYNLNSTYDYFLTEVISDYTGAGITSPSPKADIWGSNIIYVSGGDVYLTNIQGLDLSNIGKKVPNDRSKDDPQTNNSDVKPSELTIEDLIKWYAPNYLFSQDEKYYPTNPYADDSDVTNNALNWQKGDFPNNETIYYAVTDYSNKISTEHPKGFKVIQYWSYYVYNDWGADEHEYDWEVIHKWVDNKSGAVFHTSASMHFWDNNYQENIDTFWVEGGGHGTSKDLFMLDHIEMPINYGSKSLFGNSYELHPLEDLLKYNASDFWGERGKFPTDQERFKDPDNAIRLNPTRGVLTQVTIKNSPELYVVDSAGRTTGLKNGKIVESIPNSKYFPREEKIIILGNEHPVVINLKGTADEKYTLEVKTVTGDKEDVRFENNSIKKGETTKLRFSDLQKDESKNNLQNNQTNYPLVAAIGGAVASAIGLTAYRKKQQSKLTKSQQITPTKNVIIPQIKPNENISLANSDDSESDKSKLKSNSIKDLEDK